MVVGGGVPATAVVKRIKLPVIEHHGIKAKLEPRRARTKAHRGAPATPTLCDGGAAGREKERRRTVFHSEIK